MTWTKLSDDFPDDCDTLSDHAFRLHVEGLCWSNRKLLDLEIPKDHLRRFATHPDAARELADVGWWSDEGDAYVIRHHAIYQRTREAVLKQQAANEANGRKGGRPRKPREQVSDLSPETQSVSESLSEPKTERDGTGLAGIRKISESTDFDSPDWLAGGTGRPSSPRCSVCELALDPKLAAAGDDTHPLCA